MKKKILLFLVVLIIISVYKSTNSFYYIPDSSIRLRVIPNSNNSNDIYIKEKVKTYLEDNLYSLTKNVDNIDEARIIIKSNIPILQNSIDNIFINNNYHEKYDINFGNNYFPEKYYKGKLYSEGYYESLVIKIGEGKGDNWWCVLFPNYCLIDTQNKTKYKSLIKEIIDNYSK